MINNDDELKASVDEINKHFKAIQEYLGQEPHANGKIKFPRGFIRHADHFRSQLGFVRNDAIKNNLAYSLILSDVYLWLVTRTDLYGTANEMVLKSGIALMGTICETMAIDATKGIIGKNHSFCERTIRMQDKGIITEPLKIELHWLWEARAAIHIYELDHKEHEKYKTKDYNRAIRATRDLRDALNIYYS